MVYFVFLGGKFVMKIIKIFNNNTVATFSKDKTEMIVTGPGIGFKKHVGDDLDETKIQKRYVVENAQKEAFYKMLEKTPIEYFEISQNICKRANKEFKGGVSSQFVMLLTDHISFAIERKKQNITIPNLLLSETQTLYPDEYKVSLWALRYIHARTGIALPEDEAGFIAIHLINVNHSGQSAQAVLDFCKGVFDIIEKALHKKLNFNSFTEKRLFMHLKYLGQRIFMHEQGSLDSKIDKDFMMKVLQENPDIKQCLDNIEKYVWNRYDYKLHENELFYIMIHIYKINE